MEKNIIRWNLIKYPDNLINEHKNKITKDKKI